MSSTVFQYLGQPCTKHHDVKVLPVPTYNYSVVVLCFIFVLFVVFCVSLKLLNVMQISTTTFN